MHIGAVRRLVGNLSRCFGVCKQRLIIAAFIFAVFAQGGAFASDAQVKALHAIKDEKWTQAYKLAKDLDDPLMMKIYYWQRFQSDDNQGSFAGISRFVRQNPDWPSMSSVRYQLEERLTGRENQAAILRWFEEYAPITPQGFIAQAQALLRVNKRDEFKALINEWWATTLMERADQKYIYRLYGDHITLDSHTRRFDKLLFNKQYTNARAVAQVLGGGYPALTEARIALAANKNGVDARIQAVPQALQNDPGLMYERLKWRRKKGMDTRAIEILDNPPPYEKITNPNDWWRERHIIVRRLMERGDFKKAYQVASSHIQREGFAYAQAQWLAGWLAMTYMHKPAEAFARFQELETKVSTPVSLARAQYWAGRAAQMLDNKELAQSWFSRAAQYQTVFYGQKAALHVRDKSLLSSMSSPNLTQGEKQRFSRDDLIRAAHLYHQADMDNVASDFLWAFVVKEGSAEAYMYAILTAADIGYYKDVVAIAKYATRKGLFITKQSYPLRTADMKYVPAHVDPALVHALMRQESQFNTKAQSPVGALGLMQLMPATARLVARQIGVKHKTAWLTERPAHNIRLGSAYIGDLLKRYDGDYVLAIAAYNAGPGRVNRWLKTFGDPRTSEISHMDWIELMPIYETRNYVQRVMEGLRVYRLLLKENASQ